MNPLPIQLGLTALAVLAMWRLVSGSGRAANLNRLVLMGPGLKGLFKRDKMTNGKKATDATVRAKIDEGGNGMPAYKDMLSDQEKDDVIAYLKTL